MTRIIALAMQKGGVSKTTAAVNIAASLAQAGKKVLLVDSDPQGSATRACMPPTEIGFEKNLYTVYGDAEWDGAIIRTEHGFDMLPTDNDDLGAVEWEYNIQTNPVNRTLLSTTLESIKASYDFIIIDLPPDLGTLTVNGLTAATDVLVPLQPEVFAADGVQALMNTMEDVRAKTNPSLRLLGIFLTMVDRYSLHREVEAGARQYFAAQGVTVFETKIRRSACFAKSQDMGKPTVLAFPKNKAAQAYVELTKEAFGDE